MTSAFRAVAVLVVLVAVVAGCQSMTGKSTGTNIDDATITASVKSKLVGEKASNLTRVDVDTNNGTVYLNGTVESAEQKAKAEQLAGQASASRLSSTTSRSTSGKRTVVRHAAGAASGPCRVAGATLEATHARPDQPWAE